LVRFVTPEGLLADAKGVSTYPGAEHAGPIGYTPGYALGYQPLVGGEAVPIDLRVARIGSRAIAAVIDLVIQIFALGFLNGLILSLGNLDSAAQQAVAVILVVAVLIGYPVVLEAAWGGRTFGKAAMGLRAARDDGGPLRFRHALVRGLLGAFVEKPGISLGLVAIICSATSSRGKRLGDVLAGTVVLQVRLPAPGAYIPPMPPPLAGWATTLDLSRFDDTLALQCRQFLGRAGQLSDVARERLGTALVAQVGSVVTPAPPPGVPGWAYLAAVLNERRRREELRLYGVSSAPPPPWGPPPVGPAAPTPVFARQDPPAPSATGPLAPPS
jgi:uncharacterized RDD family membrane protein YckC